MSEPVETPEDRIKPVELIVCRGVVFKGVDKKPGEKIQVPAKDKHDGIYPVRWWLANKKAARTQAEAKQIMAELSGEAEPKAEK